MLSIADVVPFAESVGIQPHLSHTGSLQITLKVWKLPTYEEMLIPFS